MSLPFGRRKFSCWKNFCCSSLCLPTEIPDREYCAHRHQARGLNHRDRLLDVCLHEIAPVDRTTLLAWRREKALLFSVPKGDDQTETGHSGLGSGAVAVLNGQVSSCWIVRLA